MVAFRLYDSVKTRTNIPALLEIMSCDLGDDNQVIEVKIFSPMGQNRWIDLQQRINAVSQSEEFTVST